MPTKSVAEIRQLLEKLYPERTLRLRCLSLFAESIKHAHSHAPDNWVVVVPSNQSRIRLTVGHLVPFTLERGKVWMALDLEALEELPQAMMLLNEAQGWQWQTGLYSEYKPVPSRNGYYFPDADPSEKLFPTVWELNCAYVKRIGILKYKLHPQSRRAYQPAILEFLRQELKCSLLEPGTQPQIDIELPEEVSENEVFPEGTRKQISVNAYERNPTARRKCLEYYGTCCAVCTQDMSEIYGPAAAGLIHVHHLKPLSKVREGYCVDPIDDLRPVCPNCHAVIHRRKRPYTIEEVKKFLEKAKRDT